MTPEPVFTIKLSLVVLKPACHNSDKGNPKDRINKTKQKTILGVGKDRVNLPSSIIF